MPPALKLSSAAVAAFPSSGSGAGASSVAALVSSSGASASSSAAAVAALARPPAPAPAPAHRPWSRSPPAPHQRVVVCRRRRACVPRLQRQHAPPSPPVRSRRGLAACESSAAGAESDATGCAPASSLPCRRAPSASSLSFRAPRRPIHPPPTIVRVDADAKPSVYPTHAHWYEAAVLAAAGDGAGWPEGGPLIHTYSTAFHGFSARMSPSAADALAATPGVAAVVPERVRQLATTRSPRFLGLLSSPPSALLADSDFGADLVIAIVDTGISPVH